MSKQQIPMHIHTADSPMQLAKDFAEYFARWAADKDRVNIALSGGSTPGKLFRLWGDGFGPDVDWENIHFFWGDERCVPPDDPESNYKMAYDLFLEPLRVPSCNIHRIKGEMPAEAEAGRYAEELSEELPMENGYPVFDMVLLGLGSDGHTASIFPDQIQLLDSEEACAVAEHPVSGQQRITLTGNVLNNAREVVFLVTGKGKQERVREILNQEDTAGQYPASHIHPKHGKLMWYLDRAAAEKAV